VPDEKWAQYALNSCEPTLEVRPMLRRGEPLPYWLGRTPGRVGRSNRDVLRAQWTIVSHSIGGKRMPRSGGGSGMHVDVWGGRVSGSQLHMEEKDLAGVRDGEITVAVEIEQEFFEMGPQWPGKSLGKRTTTITRPLELVPADAETVKVVTDPSLRDAVEKSLKVESWHITTGGNSRTVFVEDDDHVEVSIHAYNPPVGLACDVYLKTPRQEWHVGTASYLAGKRGGWGMRQELADMKGFAAAKPQRVDIVLRPSLKVARNTVDILQMWDGEVVLPDVPVQHVMSPQKAATTRKAAAVR
jgi:hypothetical protein